MARRFEKIRDGRRRERARHVARVVTTRAVRQNEERQIRTQQDRVLVVLAHLADVGPSSRRHLERQKEARKISHARDDTPSGRAARSVRVTKK